MKWFKKTEMIRCYRERQQDRCRECRLQQPATRLPNGIEESIVALTEQVLDPAREALEKPVVVNSGFRCPLHNSRVGGVANSQHMKGEAADVCCADNERLAEIIEQNGCYDQLIRYLNKDGSIRFIHVSWKRNGANRKMKFNK